MTDAPKRSIRKPHEIAQDELEAATARVESAAKRVTKAKEEVTAAEAAHKAAVRRADYAAQHPDLPENAEKNAPDDDYPAEDEGVPEERGLSV